MSTQQLPLVLAAFTSYISTVTSLSLSSQLVSSTGCSRAEISAVHHFSLHQTSQIPCTLLSSNLIFKLVVSKETTRIMRFSAAWGRAAGIRLYMGKRKSGSFWDFRYQVLHSRHVFDLTAALDNVDEAKLDPAVRGRKKSPLYFL